MSLISPEGVPRKENLILCEARLFPGGAAAIDTVFRRTAVSGRVDDGRIDNHFAFILNMDGGIMQTIALDRRSYATMNYRWMPCKVQK